MKSKFKLWAYSAFLSGLLILFPLISLAQAASFDCDAAPAPHGTAIEALITTPNTTLELSGTCDFVGDNVTISAANITIESGSKAVLLGDANDPTVSTRNIFEATAAAQGLTIRDLIFKPGNGPSGRAVLVLDGTDNVTFERNEVRNFTDAVYCLGHDCDNLTVKRNKMTIVDRLPTAGGNAAVTTLEGCDNLRVEKNRIIGPGALKGRPTAVVGISDFNKVTAALDINIDRNRIKGFDIGIFVSSTSSVGNKGKVQRNRIRNCGDGIQLGQLDPPVTLAASSLTVEKNRARRNEHDGIQLNKAVSNIVKRNNASRNKNIGFFLDTGSSNNHIALNTGKNNTVWDLCDNGTGNIFNNNIFGTICP